MNRVLHSRFPPFGFKARWVGPYAFKRVMADLQSPMFLKGVLLVLVLRMVAADSNVVIVIDASVNLDRS